MKAKYINPYTDFGFKKIFGEEASKPLLIDFLNALLPEQNKIIDISFKNTEQLGLNDFDRKAVYEQNLKTYRDYKSTVDTAFDEGKIEGKVEGIKEGKMETARQLKNLGVDIQVIIKSTGLSADEIDKR